MEQIVELYCQNCDRHTNHRFVGNFRDGIRFLGRYLCKDCGTEQENTATIGGTIVKEIQQIDTWLGRRMQDMSEVQLATLFKEIAGFRRTGILKGEELRKLARDFSDNVTHTEYGQNMRLIEDEVLFEMSRRYFNSIMF